MPAHIDRSLGADSLRPLRKPLPTLEFCERAGVALTRSPVSDLKPHHARERVQ
jgi:hypothetical protein